MFPGGKTEENNLNIKHILFLNKALLFSVVLIVILINLDFLNLFLRIIILVFVFLADFFLISYFLSKKADNYKKKIDKRLEFLESEITDINRESTEMLINKALSEYKGKTEEYQNQINKPVIEILTLLNEVKAKLSKQESSVKDINNSKDILDSRFHMLKDVLEEISKKVVMSYDVSNNISNSANEAFNLSEKIKSGIKLVSDSLNQALDYSNVLY
ncbi:MAG: hypothetical protein GXP33_10935, partial [Spirochaetes bacterium]|nr:hypothetical protein [Spirochaetota bacterium]